MPAVSREEGRAQAAGIWHLFMMLNATLVTGTCTALHGRQAFDRPSSSVSHVGGREGTSLADQREAI